VYHESAFVRSVSPDLYSDNFALKITGERSVRSRRCNHDGRYYLSTPGAVLVPLPCGCEAPASALMLPL
jgi:hypothetical protein